MTLPGKMSATVYFSLASALEHIETPKPSLSMQAIA
jgi:hypothetical protein